MKNLTATLDEKTEHIKFLGVLENSNLTPTIAKMAARQAFGQVAGVTVVDRNGDGYRFFSEKRNSHRKVHIEPSCPECGSTEIEQRDLGLDRGTCTSHVEQRCADCKTEVE